MSLQDLFVIDLYAFFMVFTRLGAAFVFMVGFASVAVSVTIRLAAALVIALVMTPLVSPLLPPMPPDGTGLFLVMAGEALIGLYFGLFTLIMLTTVQIAGTIIAFQIAMANAFVSDPALQSQSSVIGQFLSQCCLILIFVTGLDHLMLNALFESYSLFPPGRLLPVGDMAEFMSRLVNDTFSIALQLSAPFVVAALLVQTGMGLLNKLVPNIQIFFIIMPAQVWKGLFLLALCIPAILLAFATFFENQLENFIML